MPRFMVFWSLIITSAFSFEPAVRPLLDAHCIDCHGADVQKGKLRLDGEVTMNTWIKVHDKLASGEMPPKKEEQPEQALRDESLAIHRHATHLT